MANHFGNPIVLDTAMPESWRQTEDHNAPNNQGIHVRKIVWDAGPDPSPANTVYLTYADETPLFSATVSSNQPLDFPGGHSVRDFQLHQISSGKLYLYY